MHIGFISTHIDEISGGIGRYSYELIKNLNDIDRKNEYYLIHNASSKLGIYKDNKDVLLESFLPNTLWRFSYAPFKLKNFKNLDLVHDPYPIGPLSFNMPFKKILTVCDLAHIIYPHSTTLKVTLGHKLFLRKTLEKADKIIAISNNTKNDLMHYFHLDEKDIQVIHLGVDERFRQMNLDEINNFKAKNNLHYPFILYVGGLEPRKNVPALIKAFYKIKKTGISHKLILTGKKSWNYKNVINCIQRLNLQDEVVFLDYVSDLDLPALYNAADLFVYPSIYEGFGIPPLEAMACGTPVVTSNISSLPEVVGEAGIMVNPWDIDDIAKALKQVLNNDELKYGIKIKCLKQAKKFNWVKCAEETLKVYERTIHL